MTLVIQKRKKKGETHPLIQKMNAVTCKTGTMVGEAHGVPRGGRGVKKSYT